MKKFALILTGVIAAIITIIAFINSAKSDDVVDSFDDDDDDDEYEYNPSFN